MIKIPLELSTAGQASSGTHPTTTKTSGSIMNLDYVYHKFCEKRFPLPSEKDVESLEERIGIELPPDFREYVLLHNGGYFNEPQIIPPQEYEQDCPIDRLRYMQGINASHPTAELATEIDLSLFDDNDPPEVVPIGYTIMGNLILLLTYPEPETYGHIMLKTFTDYYYLAKGIEEFFDLLAEPSDTIN
jgi:cell wall assembly regulator SMI1